MKFSTPFLAKDLKKELTSIGVKVLRCSQTNQNALLTINNDNKSLDLFLSFCVLNNYGAVCGGTFVDAANRIKESKQSFFDMGNIFKYTDVKC